MSDMLPAATSVLALHVGRARERWEGKPPSAIAKEPVPEALDLGYEGFSADEQADRKVHGGPEKAVHHYPAAHYAWWRERFPDHEDVLRPGGFGENIVADGLDEDSVCLGDRFRLGRALVEICQGRQPCWKLAAHTGIAAMAGAMQKSGRTGWYYRVLEPGSVAAGDEIAIQERPLPDWPLARIIAARFDPRIDPRLAEEIAGLAPLSQSWRASFVKKSDASYAEDTRERLSGPGA
uniref:MOSC domain-containing protein n=1 Tax=Stappia sp. TaxID=1870903 RepID=UPI003BAA643F